MATIGLRDIYYALLTDDPLTGVPVYETPIKVKGAMSANLNPNSSSETLFYDDGPGDTASTIGNIELELNIADIPLDVQAVWFGHLYNKGILMKAGSDTPPFLAIAYRTLKSTGGYRYSWLLKGKFQLPEEAYETKGDSITFNTPTVTGSFVKRDCDDMWQWQADSDTAAFDPSYMDTWFVSPNVTGGVSDSDTYAGTLVTVASATVPAATTVTISASDTTTVGEETAVWSASALAITLADLTSYSAKSLQAIINKATGTSLGQLSIRTNKTLVAAKATTVTLTLAKV